MTELTTATGGALLSREEMDAARERLPIVYVDVVPVRVDEEGTVIAVGLLLRAAALERAAKLQRRAARTGFDWPDASGPRAKIDEELEELERETEHQPMFEEMGDLLFAVVNLARKLNIEPEAALREANHKFERRFREIEITPGFSELSLDEMEELWQRAKKAQADSIA